MCFHKKDVPKQIEKTVDGMYFDMPISMDCIEYVILGPEFGTSELDEIISHTEYRIEYILFIQDFTNQISLTVHCILPLC